MVTRCCARYYPSSCPTPAPTRVVRGDGADNARCVQPELSQFAPVDTHRRSEAPLFSGAPIADLLLGLPSFDLQAKFDNRQSLRSGAHNMLGQDDWRIAPRLNLSFGLLCEYNTPPVGRADRMYIFNRPPRA